MPLRIHLDTDIGGDTDDLCALALLLASPEVELVGITTCADAEGLRRSFALHALRLAGRTGIPVATGARGFLLGKEHFPQAQDARYWPGLKTASSTPTGEALELLEANAAAGATIVAVGPFTNIALLEALRPGVFANAPVVVMGGYLGLPQAGYPQWPASFDYNVQSDRAAARIVFERLNPLVASLNVTLKTALRARDLSALREAGPLAQLIAHQAELHAEDRQTPELARRFHRLPPDILNFQYDSVACAAAIGLPGLVIAETPHAVAYAGDELVLQPDPNGAVRRFVTDVDPEPFAAEWLRRVCTL